MRLRALVVFIVVLSLTVSLRGAGPDRVAEQLRSEFPILRLESDAAFESADQVVAGRLVPGLRARLSQPRDVEVPGHVVPVPPGTGGRSALRVTWPRFCSDPVVAERGVRISTTA